MWDGGEARQSREPDILCATLGTRGAIVSIEEPPSPLHPICSFFCFQLRVVTAVHPNFLRKLICAHCLSTETAGYMYAERGSTPTANV